MTPRRIAPFFLALLALILLLLVAYNPAYSPPLIPEFLSLTLILLAGALSAETDDKPSLSAGEKKLLIGLWLALLLITTPRALWSLSHLPGQNWSPCQTLSMAGGLRCYLQAAITQNYGLRTLLLNYSALGFGMAGFFISRTRHDGGRHIVGAIIGSAFLVLIAGYLSPFMEYLNAFDFVRLLPRALLYTPTLHTRFTEFFPNPSWVWPYLIPATDFVIFRSLNSQTPRRRILYAVMALLFMGAFLLNRQRGAVLTVIVFLGITLLYFVDERKGRRALYRLLLALAIILVLVSITLLLWFPEITDKFVSMERLQMWLGGIEYFRARPLRGQGYAVWFNVINTYAVTRGFPGITYDTAHNLYIQLFTELGLLHGGLLLGLFVWLVLLIRSRLLILERGGLVFALFLAGVLLVTLVQEIDYLRTTYYLYALLAGVLAGRGERAVAESESLPVGKSLPVTESPRESIRSQAGESTTSPSPHRLPRLVTILLAGGGVLFLGGALMRLNFLEFGIFPYEANIYLPQSPIRRWLGSVSLLIASKDETAKTYSQYFLHAPNRSSFYTFRNRGTPLTIRRSPGWRIALPLENGSFLFPRRYLISSGPPLPSDPRPITMQLEYPFVQSNLALFRTKNLEPTHPGDRSGFYRCRLNCEFIARSCGTLRELRFQLRLPRRRGELNLEIGAALLKGGPNSAQRIPITTSRLKGLPERTTDTPLRFRLPAGTKGDFFHIRIREEKGRGSVILLKDDQC